MTKFITETYKMTSTSSMGRFLDGEKLSGGNKNAGYRTLPIRLPAHIAFLFFVVALAMSFPVSAQEAWCTANPANCVMSESFQSTSYTRVVDYGTGAAFLGNQTGSKPGELSGVTASINAIYNGNTFASTLAISTDPDVLSKLPNRNTSSVARFLRHGGNAKGVNQNSTYNFGHTNIDLTGVKRLALRWYMYHSDPYDFAFETNAGCSNGKWAHISAGYNRTPMITIQSNRNRTHAYSFSPTGAGGGPTPSWLWSGHTSYFHGFFSGTNTYVEPVALSSLRGKWWRFEIVVSNPRATDAGGFDYSLFMKNVTDGTPEVEDSRFSAGCAGCVDGVGDFTWDTSIHPAEDLKSLHTILYRMGWPGNGDGSCDGWQGWLYAAIAKWDTNAGQRIGAAVEVEGGAGGIVVGPPQNLQVF